MMERTIAAVSLSNEDFDSFDAKLAEARRWVEFAAGNGADLVVLPECLDQYRGDGPHNPDSLSLSEIALDDWKARCATLIDAARQCEVAVVIPVHTRERGVYTNSSFLVSERGETIGRFVKIFPTDSELESGIEPGSLDQQPLPWRGCRIGGAICYDTNYPEVFERQVRNGANLFVVPSLWPGGTQLNHYALRHSTPIVLSYPAWSRIIDLDGRQLAAGGYRNETLRFGYGAPVVQATINFDRIAMSADGNQEKIVDLQRTYGSDIRVTFDQDNCLFFLESRSPALTTSRIVEDFDLTPWQAKLAHSAAKRRRHLSAASPVDEPQVQPASNALA